jgi:hypothetical protein
MIFKEILKDLDMCVMPYVFDVQASLTLRGRYVPSFWTTNIAFADKKSIFDRKMFILDKKSANDEGRLYCI